MPRLPRLSIAALAALLLLTPASLADWIDYVDETSTRLVAASDLGVADVREKDYDWGDVDRDGDTDLVVVRKEPFTSEGKDPNVLFINEAGVLTDRTSDFAAASDVVGDQGFLTPTNDRDVKLVDVNLDGWLDIVTAPTISVGDPKHIGHPRIYINQCCNNDCSATSCTTANWSGFLHEDARIPAMLSYAGLGGLNPCFCSVSFGDLTGDGYPELYFGDYDSGGGGVAGGDCQADDFNDRLLLNQGVSNPGFFTDVTSSRFSGIVPGASQSFEVSAFGASNFIADVNGDAVNDIVKQTSLSAPTYVGTAFSDPLDLGFYDTYDNTYSFSPYFVTGADLNNDDKLDMIVSDDGPDRYLVNDGNGDDDIADFTSYFFSYFHSGAGGAAGDDGFGGNNLIVDLNHDGWLDAVIADVDVDTEGCDRRMHIFRNLTTMAGGTVVLEEQTSGADCLNLFGNSPDCIVASIPADKLEGVHDVAVFDIDGDDWNDLVLGRCSSTEIYRGIPQIMGSGAVPDGGAVAGTQLTLDKAGGTEITLSWGPSCNFDDTTYGIYEGVLGGAFNTHVSRDCDTGGAVSKTLAPGMGSHYYLVVPIGADHEGSYGTNSQLTERPPGGNACQSQAITTCL